MSDLPDKFPSIVLNPNRPAQAFGRLVRGLQIQWNLIVAAFRKWEDLRVPVNAVKLSGVKPPAWTSYKGGEVLAFGDEAVEGNEEVVYFSAQLPHSYEEGTDIEFHVHWVPEDNAGGNVRWKFTHSWANIGAAFPGETTVTADSAAGTTTDLHVYSDTGDITGTGKTISSMLICSLKRNSSHANDTLTGKSAYLIEVDFHFRRNSIGSKEETSK